MDTQLTLLFFSTPRTMPQLLINLAGYVYFLAFPKDPWTFKALVSGCLVMALIDTIANLAWSYDWIVKKCEYRRSFQASFRPHRCLTGGMIPGTTTMPQYV